MQLCYHSGWFGNDVMVFQPQLKILVNRDEIAKTVDRLAAEIARDYQGRKPLLIGVLKGAFMFTADLVRRLDPPLEIEFIKLSSYGCARESAGKVRAIQP